MLQPRAVQERSASRLRETPRQGLLAWPTGRVSDTEDQRVISMLGSPDVLQVGHDLQTINCKAALQSHLSCPFLQEILSSIKRFFRCRKVHRQHWGNVGRVHYLTLLILYPKVITQGPPLCLTDWSSVWTVESTTHVCCNCSSLMGNGRKQDPNNIN